MADGDAGGDAPGDGALDEDASDSTIGLSDGEAVEGAGTGDSGES